MGYLHIDNLYKDTRILEFRQVYALEKIHGTSAHISLKEVGGKRRLVFFSGGEKHSRFVALFGDEEELLRKFEALGVAECTVYGEAYGGRQQGMKETYGPELRFVCFDVKIDDNWLSVPQAEDVVGSLGLEFVDYALVPTELAALDAQRDADSTQAVRNGVGEGKKREGVVLRPVFEVTLNNGKRLIAKHKRDDFRETRTTRQVGVDPKVLSDARAVAEEWVTPMRLEHVLQKLPDATGMEHTREVVSAMVEDVLREGEGEIVVSKPVKKEIGKAAVALWKKRVMQVPQ